MGEAKTLPNSASFLTETESRLDSLLALKFPEFSRNFWAEECKQGVILVKGIVASPGTTVRVGEKVELLREPKRAKARQRESFSAAFKVLFEDSDIAVIEKPRGAPSITLSENDPETAADFLVSRFPTCLDAGEDKREGGLIHRLDTWASGLMVAAKRRESWEKLRGELNGGKIEKEYLVLAEGPLSGERELELYLSGAGKRVKVSKEPKAGFEKTWTKVSIERELSESLSIVRVSAALAKRHQVRAVLAFIGRPLVGDELYGAGMSLSEVTGAEENGFVLHAAKIAFAHPRLKTRMEFESKNEILERL